MFSKETRQESAKGCAVPDEANGSPHPQIEQAQDEFAEKMKAIVTMKTVRPKRLIVLNILFSLNGWNE